MEVKTHTGSEYSIKYFALRMYYEKLIFFLHQYFYAVLIRFRKGIEYGVCSYNAVIQKAHL